MAKHLWQVKHPYYMTHGCYFSNECHQEFASWEHFLSEWGSTDEDYNMVIRFDWIEACAKNEIFNEVLNIQFFLQRKAYPISCRIQIEKSDEPEVIKYLAERAEYIARMWEPFLQSSDVDRTLND